MLGYPFTDSDSDDDDTLIPVHHDLTLEAIASSDHEVPTQVLLSSHMDWPFTCKSTIARNIPEHYRDVITRYPQRGSLGDIIRYLVEGPKLNLLLVGLKCYDRGAHVVAFAHDRGEDIPALIEFERALHICGVHNSARDARWWYQMRSLGMAAINKVPLPSSRDHVGFERDDENAKVTGAVIGAALRQCKPGCHVVCMGAGVSDQVRIVMDTNLGIDTSKFVLYSCRNPAASSKRKADAAATQDEDNEPWHPPAGLVRKMKSIATHAGRPH